jgi:hypothetical protein
VNTPRLPLRASRLRRRGRPVKLVLDGTDRTLSAAIPSIAGSIMG